MYYKVRLYLYDNDSPMFPIYVQDIVVKNGLFDYAKEICTNCKFFVVPIDQTEDTFLFDNELIVYAEGFVNNNLVSDEYVSKYIDTFDYEKFNRVLKQDYRYKKKLKKRLEKQLKKL